MTATSHSRSGYGSIHTTDGVKDRDWRQERPGRKSLMMAGSVTTVLVVLGLLGIVLWASLTNEPLNSTPSLSQDRTPHYYREQLVNHNDLSEGTYSQRYYQNDDYFGGPGHPIFLIMGGEDPLEGILYPFVSRNLARQFSALTLCLEHRFYGTSLPVAMEQWTEPDVFPRLLSPDQALEDAVQFIRHIQTSNGCSLDRTETDRYCPVMTVGGSYPGFLSALLRLQYPEVVDIGYASSSPLHLYSHSVDPKAYYEKVSQVAEAASPGCAQAVYTVLEALRLVMQTSSNASQTESSRLHVEAQAHGLGLCLDTLPEYIDSPEVLYQEVEMVVATAFAEYDMAYYPPGPHQVLVQGCRVFQQHVDRPHHAVREFLFERQETSECFDLTEEQPPGPNGRISAADWSGVGSGPQGWAWDFSTCTLIPTCSLSGMFPSRPWTMEWQTQYCQNRFGYTPDLNALVDRYHFDDLSTASRLLLTNGIHDGWSVASVTTSPSPGVLVVNLPNGAHHSDLTHVGPTSQDTPDVLASFGKISTQISIWLKEVAESGTST